MTLKELNTGDRFIFKGNNKTTYEMRGKFENKITGKNITHNLHTDWRRYEFEKEVELI